MVEVKKQAFYTKTLGDDAKMWIKKSIPMDERQRTRPLRCLARAMFSWWESQAGPERPDPPSEFMVDYWRGELVMQDEVVAKVNGEKFIFVENAWARHLPDIPMDHIKESATSYVKGEE